MVSVFNLSNAWPAHRLSRHDGNFSVIEELIRIETVAYIYRWTKKRSGVLEAILPRLSREAQHHRTAYEQHINGALLVQYMYLI